MANLKYIPSVLDKLLKNAEDTRYATMMYTAVIFLFILGVRLFFLQIGEGDYYRNAAEGNRIRRVPLQAARGVIYDRNGEVMAGSRSSYNVILPIDRKENSLSDDELKKLSVLLRISADELKKRIEDNRYAFGSVYLARDVDLGVATQIEEKKGEYPGVEIEISPLRTYPFGVSGAQMIGYVGLAGEADRDGDGNPYRGNALVGRAGIEAQYNNYLEGKNGYRNVEVDASGQPVAYMKGDDAVAGYNVRLTIDAKLQQVAESAIEEQVALLADNGVFPTGASAVAVDPRSGAVLAIVSWPNFDPNQFARGISDQDWQMILNNPNHPLQNRAISSVYPPGSLFKVITAATALESKVMQPEEKIYDNGKHWLIDKQNAQGEAFGWVDFYDAMAKSDNVYFYEMGRRVGIDRLSKMATAFGLGEKTGIDLYGESSGNVASQAYKREVFDQDWYLGETFDAAIGQSFNLATPLQMAMAYASIANGGYLYKPYIVSRIDNHDGTPMIIFPAKSTGSLPVSKTTLSVIQKSLRMVMEKDGTGGFLFQKYPVSIAGKSGTAETNGLDNGWFAAYAPFDSPEIVIVCVFEHSGFGADSAAPVVKKMMDAYFHVKPTSPQEPSEKGENQ